MPINDSSNPYVAQTPSADAAAAAKRYQDMMDAMAQANAEKAKAEAMTSDQARTQQYTDQATAARTQDMAAGAARGQQIFGDGSLGRVDASRSSEIADLIQQRKANLSGMSPEEQNSFKNDTLNSLRQEQQGQMRQMQSAQANSGVRGATATAQMADLSKNFGQQQANMEQQTFAHNQDLRRTALDSFDTTLNKARSDELARQQINMGQAGKEKYGQLSTEMGYGSLGVADRSAIMQRLVGEKQAQAATDYANKDSGKK